MSDSPHQRRTGSFNKHSAPRGEISNGKIAVLAGVMLVCVLGLAFLLIR